MPTHEFEQEILSGFVRQSQLALEVFLQGKWCVHILWVLRNGSIRIGELGRLIPGASKKVLVQHLRRLEADGIIVRNDMSDLVLHIEYELIASFHSLVCDLLDCLSESGALYFRQTEKIQPWNSWVYLDGISEPKLMNDTSKRKTASDLWRVTEEDVS